LSQKFLGVVHKVGHVTFDNSSIPNHHIVKAHNHWVSPQNHDVIDEQLLSGNDFLMTIVRKVKKQILNLNLSVCFSIDSKRAQNEDPKKGFLIKVPSFQTS
jgi:hypothetical protein